MLIRVQEKTRLINFDKVAYTVGGTPSLQGYAIQMYFDKGIHEKAGIYSTKAKAIKVLDMIQDAYARHYYGQGGQSATSNTVYQPFGFIPPKVFQMPSDEELEEGAVKDE